MILNNIKQNKKNNGFTIVELLVVIIVIGILAAITIVSYVGITARANTAKALSNAVAVQSIADTFFADKAFYPASNASTPMTLSDWTTQPTITKLPASITLKNSTITANDQSTLVSIECQKKAAETTCAASPTGLRFGYWDSTLATPAPAYIYSGTASASETFVFPAS